LTKLPWALFCLILSILFRLRYLDARKSMQQDVQDETG
jgi:hypothetical protein